MDEYENSKIERNIFRKELISLALPIGLQSLLVSLVGATDALMLGRYAQDAVSAVSLANQIAFIMNMFIAAITSGGGVLLAQYYGKGEKEMVKNIFCLIIRWSFLISIIFFILSQAIPDVLMRIYTSDETLISVGSSYLRIVGFSYLTTGITQSYFVLMKLDGKAKISVLISVATLGLDIAIDSFLIYGSKWMPKLGANGTAYSTRLTEVVALIWCIAESLRKGSIRADLSGLKWFSKPIVKDFMKVSLPMLASTLIWGVGFSLHSVIMGHIGNDATAASSITSVAQELIACVCRGISAGAGIMIGKLLSNNDFDKAKSYGKRFCKISIMVGVVNIGLLCIMGPIVSLFFILTETARQYLNVMLIFSSLYVFAYSINTIIVCGVFPAGGDSKYDAISVLFATWCFSLPLALLGAFVFNFHVHAVYAIMCADEIVKIPWVFPHYKKYKWLKNITRDESQDLETAL